jgi:hypothetical protein
MCASVKLNYKYKIYYEHKTPLQFRKTILRTLMQQFFPNAGKSYKTNMDYCVKLGCEQK